MIDHATLCNIYNNLHRKIIHMYAHAAIPFLFIIINNYSQVWLNKIVKELSWQTSIALICKMTQLFCNSTRSFDHKLYVINCTQRQYVEYSIQFEAVIITRAVVSSSSDNKLCYRKREDQDVRNNLHVSSVCHGFGLRK